MSRRAGGVALHRPRPPPGSRKKARTPPTASEPLLVGGTHAPIHSDEPAPAAEAGPGLGVEGEGGAVPVSRLLFGSEGQGHKSVEGCRVMFNGAAGATVHSGITIINDGTTAVFLDWEEGPGDTGSGTRRDTTRRFFFNPARLVVLPQAEVRVPVTFHSPNAGVFSKNLSFKSQPPLSSPISLTFFGIASSVDATKEKRAEIAARLERSSVERSMRQLVLGVIQRLRPTPPPVQPRPVTQGENFAALNPGICQLHNPATEQQLEALYRTVWLQVNEPEAAAALSKPSTPARKAKGDKTKDSAQPAVSIPPWDRKIAALQQMMLGLDDAACEGHLKRLNDLVAELERPAPAVCDSVGRLAVGADVLVGLFDEIGRQAADLHDAAGVPLAPLVVKGEQQGGGKESKKGRGKSGKASATGRKTEAKGRAPEPDAEQASDETKAALHRALTVQVRLALVRALDQFDRSLAPLDRVAPPDEF